MTNHLAEIKRALWKSKQPTTSEFMKGYYIRYAARLQAEYDRLPSNRK